MNPYDLLVAPLLFFSIWGGFRAFKRSNKVETKKSNIPKPSNVEITPKAEEKVFSFQRPWDTVCPMCRHEVHLLRHTFCSCEKCSFGHFHIYCRDSQGYGCGYKWTMKTAQ